jgi:hypothetical protein
MPKHLRICIVSAAALAVPLTIAPLTAAATNLPEAIAVSGETLVATVQAAGTQIYECKTDMSGKLEWQPREPVATLFMGGKTVGRHYAGPHWEMEDGSTVSARPTGRAPGATEDDIPLLKLEVTSWRGMGQLANVTTIQRLHTRGGVADGPCETAGMLQSVPYSADYAFYRKNTPTPAASAPAAPRSAAAGYAPAVVAVPAPAPGVHVIVLPRDLPYRPRKKRDGRPDKPGEPKSPPTAEPKGPKGPTTPPTAEPKGPTTPTPTPPTAEPKAPPAGPKTTGTTRPKYVRDHRKDPPYVVTDDRKTPEPKVRDHRGVDREPPKPRTAEGDPKVRDHRGVDPDMRQGQSPQRAPKVRDHRGVDRDPPKPRGSAGTATGSAGGGSLPCGASGLPPCRAQ